MARLWTQNIKFVSDSLTFFHTSESAFNQGVCMLQKVKEKILLIFVKIALLFAQNALIIKDHRNVNQVPNTPPTAASAGSDLNGRLE